MAVELSFCVVNTDQRELLLRCLDAIAAEREGLDFETEVLVLDNASRDGSATAASRHPLAPNVIRLERRRGKGENDTALLKRATGRYALLLNEDSELRPGAVATLREALEDHDDAAAAGARLLRPDGTVQPSAWRFPSPTTALIGALFLHKRFTVQSRGSKTRRVDWAQSAALLVRTEAAREIEWFDPAFFVYSDEVDFCRRLRDAGWRTLYVPAAEVVHHEQLSTGPVPARRIVELSRNRDRYMRKHHSAGAA
ncbi:MAG TPA: glycosyltransferase, partial [Solirubrobacteraceae bacterium]|nr:glycosyltransferase [Solirubrobacteraceae bacterium]